MLQKRLPQARRTNDLDLSTFDSRFIDIDQEARENAILEELQSSAKNDVDDYFQFKVIRGTHELPETLLPPPESWTKVYAELIRDTDIGCSLKESFETVAEFFTKALER